MEVKQGEAMFLLGANGTGKTTLLKCINHILKPKSGNVDVYKRQAFFKSEIGIICCAFAAAVLCMAVVYGISSHKGMGAETVVLTGIALNYFFSALTSAVEFFAEEHKLAAVVQWTFGTFNGTVWSLSLIHI